MGDIVSYKGKDHALIIQGSKNEISKEKQIVKQKKPKSDNEDECLKPIDEGSMKKVKTEGSTSKYYYCRNGFNIENKCFNKNLDTMSQFLEKHNIKVPDELEKHVESS